ncbi:radical SAM protein [Bacteroidota bacterium]
MKKKNKKYRSTVSLGLRIRRFLGMITKRAGLLFLEVTHLCNQRCVGCYTKAGMEKPDSLTLVEKKSVIKQAKKMGVRCVSLSGSGEPLLYKNLFELIDYIRDLGMNVVIFTNGEFISKETAQFLYNRRVHIYFKLYSLDPDVTDKMVGKKNAYNWVEYSYTYKGNLKHKKIPSGLKYLLDLRKSEKDLPLLSIETLITKMNLDTIPEAVRFAKETNIESYLETPVFSGRAIDAYSKIALNGDEYRNLYLDLAKILGEKTLKKNRKSHCGVEANPVVLTNGDIGFCSSRPANIGNVRNESLGKLFRKTQLAKRKEDRWLRNNSPASQYFRTCSSRQYYEAKYNLPCDY